jgi:hypothetical protein
LKDHLLPRINASLQQITAGTSDEITDRDQIFFQSDRRYKHHLLRINYTTYDVRRAQDMINPGTAHRDIMLLGNHPAESNCHQPAESNHAFIYARVLGIYHVKVMFRTSSGMMDYTPRRFDFLWVRWFHYHGATSVQWKDCSLDKVSFPPMAEPDSFRFVDPGDILRGCQTVPRFAQGKVHADGVSLSRCAKDGGDWKVYYMNRYVEDWFFVFVVVDARTDLLTMIWL